MKYFGISGHDNDSHLLDENHVQRCPICKQIQNKHEAGIKSAISFKIKKKKYDFSTTYDGFLIGSEKIRNLYISNNWRGIDFHGLPKSNGFFLLIPQPNFVIKFADDIRPVNFIETCNTCGLAKEVIGLFPIYIKESITNMNESIFYHTDLAFGAYDEKSHFFIISDTICNLLETNKISIVKEEVNKFISSF